VVPAHRGNIGYVRRGSARVRICTYVWSTVGASIKSTRPEVHVLGLGVRSEFRRSGSPSRSHWRGSRDSEKLETQNAGKPRVLLPPALAPPNQNLGKRWPQQQQQLREQAPPLDPERSQSGFKGYHFPIRPGPSVVPSVRQSFFFCCAHHSFVLFIFRVLMAGSFFSHWVF